MKVLLVDDEIFTIHMLQTVIPWKSMGLELIGYAQSGEEAYEKTVKENPDIIISDIRMPGMDGLEFLKKVHNYNPGIKTILMSAYADFSYVKEGMRYGCSDYILKPIDEDELEQTLRRVAFEIHGENEQKEVISKSAKKLNSLHLYHFMRSGTGKNKILDIWQGCRILDYRVFMIQISNTTMEEFDSSTNIEIGNEKYFVSALEQVVSSFDLKYFVFDYEEGNCFFIIEDSERFEAVDVAKKMADEIYGNIGVRLNICFSSLGNKMEELPELYKEVCNLGKYSFYVGEKNILGYGYNCDKGELSEVRDIGMIREMEQAIRLGEKKKALEILNEVFETSMDSSPGHWKQIYEFCYQVVMTIRSVVDGEKLNHITYEELSSQQSLKNLKAKMMEILEYLPQSEEQQITKKYSKAVKESIAIIEENYSQNLSLEEICMQVSVSKNYFCYLFKRETGMSLWNYLTVVRLQHAKKLLDETELRSYEIAFQVGYDNPSYFSKIFKKYEGMTPNEYRDVKKGIL